MSMNRGGSGIIRLILLKDFIRVEIEQVICWLIKNIKYYE